MYLVTVICQNTFVTCGFTRASITPVVAVLCEISFDVKPWTGGSLPTAGWSPRPVYTVAPLFDSSSGWRKMVLYMLSTRESINCAHLLARMPFLGAAATVVLAVKEPLNLQVSS